jgi:heat shock protein HslJ
MTTTRRPPTTRLLLVPSLHLLLLGVALVVAACGAGTLASGPPASGGTGSVGADGDWVLARGTSDGVAIPIVGGSDVTLTVNGSQVGGRSACNQYGGEVIVKDGQVQFGPMMMTEMACPEPVMVSEAAYHAALSKVRAAARDGDVLTLSGPGVELEFHRVVPPPSAALTSTEWTLDSLILGDAVSSVTGVPATLRLEVDGMLTGSTGCRPFTGRWIEQDDAVTFADITADATTCPGDLAAEDEQVLRILGGGARAAVDGDRLTIMAGTQGLGYAALAPAAS